MIHVSYQPALYIRDRDGSARCMFSGQRLGNVPDWHLAQLRRRALHQRKRDVR